MTKSTTAFDTTEQGRKLPPGRHGLSAEAVHENQRRRLTAAMAVVSVSPGFATSSIADIVRVASVSRKTFYDFFESKEQCLLAAHDDYTRRLCALVDEACAGCEERPQKVRAAIHAALTFFTSDLAVAQLLTATVLAVGHAGAERYHAMIDALAERAQIVAPTPQLTSLPDPAWRRVIVAIGMVDKAAMQGDGAAMLALEEELAALFLDSNGQAPSVDSLAGRAARNSG